MTALRIAVRVLLIVIIVVVSIALLLLLALQTPAGRQQVTRLAERQLTGALRDAEVSIDNVTGDLLRSPVIHGLTIARDGEPIISAERIEVQYDPARLLRGEVTLEQLVVQEPVVRLRQGERGLTLLDLFARDRGAPAGPPPPINLQQIVIVDGTVMIGPRVDTIAAVDVPDVLEDVDARLTLVRNDKALTIEVQQMSMETVEPALIVNQFSGTIRREADTWWFDEVMVRTANSALRLHGSFDMVTNNSARRSE